MPNNTTSADKKDVLIKIYNFEIEVFCTLVERTYSRYYCKIRYSGIDLSIFLGY